MQALVEALPGLTELEALFICNTSKRDAGPLPASQVGKYAALLPVSAHLTRLDLTWWQGCLLPGDCWQHVFAGGWQLPQLKELRIGAPERMRLDPGDGIQEAQEEIHECIQQIEPCWGSGELARLVQRCPALQLLFIPGLLQPGVDMTPLTSLTALTWLSVGGAAVDDGAASAALAGLTRLRRLYIYAAPQLTDWGLLKLTALRQLTDLKVWSSGVSEEVLADVYGTNMLDLPSPVSCSSVCVALRACAGSVAGVVGSDGARDPDASACYLSLIDSLLAVPWLPCCSATGSCCLGSRQCCEWLAAAGACHHTCAACRTPASQES